MTQKFSNLDPIKRNPQIPINPYIENIFGKWFKNIVSYLILIILAIFFIFALIKGWIDKETSFQIGYLLMGVILGRWITHGKS